MYVSVHYILYSLFLDSSQNSLPITGLLISHSCFDLEIAYQLNKNWLVNNGMAPTLTQKHYVACNEILKTLNLTPNNLSASCTTNPTSNKSFSR